jgi:hypothetical protein
MKRYFLLLSLALFSCDEDTVPREENGLEFSPYLLNQSAIVRPGDRDTAWTTYSYTPEGYFLLPGEKINLENAGSETQPFAELNGDVKLYVDQQRKVVKEENNRYSADYVYDSENRLDHVIRTFKAGNVKDTVQYTYYSKGQHDHPGEVLMFREVQYLPLPDGRLQYSYLRTTTQFYEPDKPLVAWQTQAYHYGKSIKSPMVRVTNTTANQSMRTEYYVHTYNDLNQIIKTRYSALTTVTETFYRYKSNPHAN